MANRIVHFTNRKDISMPKIRFNLQMFAEGGDGGSSSAEASAPEGGENIPSSIPPRARETYRKAMQKSQAQTPTQTTEEVSVGEEAKPTEELSYADLIKSDKYKEEHQAYMEKTIGERLKKYKGLEERQSKSDELLGLVAQKYGLDTTSESFLDDLRGKVESDESIYEQYAMDHDISTEEARRVMDLERKVAQAEMQRRVEEQMRNEEAQKAQAIERWNRLQANAERTRLQFPNFNLETEMKDERFARLCAVNNDDTTAAYMACHWSDIIRSATQTASTQAQIQTTNAIASGQNRPVEGGLSSGATAIIKQDFSKMNLEQLRAYAQEQRRLKR